MIEGTELERWLAGLAEIVGEVLWRDWDPSDVNEDPKSDQQYAEFVPGIMRLLLNEAPPSEVADFLWRIEEEQLGLSVSTADTVDAANMLVNEAKIYFSDHPRPDYTS